MKLQGVLDKVVIKPEVKDKITSSGINISQSDFYKKNTKGTVVSVGNGKLDEPMQIEVGDVVWFSKLIGISIDVEKDITKPKDEYVIVPQRDIIFIELPDDAE